MKTICVIFSKDRALQLDLTLKTLLYHSKNIDNIVVLYTTSTERHEKTYDTLKTEYPSISFVRESNFKNDLLNLVNGYSHIMFTVDDCVFVQNFDVKKIINLMFACNNCIGFSLRLGLNCTYCYPYGVNQKIRHNYFDVAENCLMFDWTRQEYDFAYPLELSSSIYKYDTINTILHSNYKNPNMLEANMASVLPALAWSSTQPHNLLCFQKSAAFCIPANRVQSTALNRFSANEKYSSESFLEGFEQGYRLDDSQFYGFIPNGCHQEVDFEFRKGIK